MYELFYEGEEPPKLPSLPNRKSSDDIAWGSTGKDSARLDGNLRWIISNHSLAAFRSDEPSLRLMFANAARYY